MDVEQRYSVEPPAEVKTPYAGVIFEGNPEFLRQMRGGTPSVDGESCPDGQSLTGDRQESEGGFHPFGLAMDS